MTSVIDASAEEEEAFTERGCVQRARPYDGGLKYS